MWPGITGVIIGLLLGGTAVALWLKRRGGSADSVAVLKRENAQFREQVNEHFVQTAELINQLTDSYKAVFDHLSEGAEKLVDPEVVRERMPQVGHEEVRLKRIGAPMPSTRTDEEKPSAVTSESTNSAESSVDEDVQPGADGPETSSAEPDRNEADFDDARVSARTSTPADSKDSESPDQNSIGDDKDRRQNP